MSDYTGSRLRDRPSLRRAVICLVVLLGLALVVGGGTLLDARSAKPAAAPTAAVGRTSSVCTVGSADALPTPSPAPGDTASPSPEPGSTPSDPASTPSDPTSTPSPSTSADEDAPTSTVSAVTVRRGATPGPGTLTGAPLAGGSGDLEVTAAGTGAQQARVRTPLLLTGEGALATAGSGAVTSLTGEGESSGLMAAPCLLPGTEQWFVGVGSSDSDRTELVLSNPDDASAEVDLRFYGPQGRVVVPGSPGVVVAGRSSRALSVSSLVDDDGPLSVAVRASEGRVSVAARRIRTDDLKPAGADWQIPSVTPGPAVVVAGVPGDAGPRSLEVVNPGPDRASVSVEVLGLSGPLAPAGADVVEVAAESTASVPLESGLAGESASVRLSSTTPVSAAVVSTSRRPDAQPDLAVQSALPPLVRQGVSAVATTTDSAASELVLSNGGDTDAATTFSVVSYTGVVLREDEILLAAGSTATRRLTSPGPSYVVVDVPDGSAVVGSVTLTQPDGDVAGLATLPLVSPDVASRAPSVEQDPAVAR
ncbi:hypothetical protein SAMN04488543_3293 [Friedmanniella luteola]|uniref:Uncharacterized protein n=1 Tax=Friedmanniella luteola TaxID=546871 RepID=A0A1H1YFR0_9ACTN|nr:DUF5719 family protein [Friedmanniella luteola]SDT20300.1 hypothetical protein SAMN04488543_3293 [Friedmanniella luteola]